ncbi:HAMP domain-containing sensor histidine kinase [Variovorax sp. J22P168]|uniref:sensor histidine kinase n=1 Tax=Variovorax jilinensis TaxID=3053513 RepID=UPI002575F321|nr:HAMP domain-containing sensor histidine kinase [Variovorax sp. J22P168]MDM0015429.1 HAMP domain-containing sensor histidine kinase [Variovorax sp. J22P168]
MKALLRPTIVQRVVLALLMAFVLVWAAMLAYIYFEFRQALAVDQGLKRVGRALTSAMEEFDGDDAKARILIRATATEYKSLRLSGNPEGSLLLQLDRRGGGLLFSSPALGSQVLSGTALQVVTQPIDGKTYWVYRSEAGPWTLHLAEPEITGQWILERNARRVLPYLFLAFPIVLIPIWLAVRLGLRPLRQLADRIARRGAGDLSPLGIEPRHAELKPLVAALEDMLRQLRDQVARERAFVHDAAHEMRTPMAVIAAQAHALSGAANSEDRTRAQGHLERAIARASHLTQQLLELASLDEARQSPLQRMDVSQLTRQLLANAAPQAMALGIEVNLDAPDGLMAEIDAPAFQSILENLVNNAIRHARGATRMTVTLQRDEGGGLRLSVEDDGQGVPESERERIFERFHRGKDPDSPGTGLGLAIVRQAAARSGGRVTLTTGLDQQGAGFHLWLPARPR